jgi:hypothetical protein
MHPAAQKCITLNALVYELILLLKRYQFPLPEVKIMNFFLRIGYVYFAVFPYQLHCIRCIFCPFSKA